MDHNQDSSIQKNQLRKNFPDYINDPKLKELPFEVLKDCVDFKIVQDNDESFQKVYSFCLNYIDENKELENVSEIFSTLDTSKISYEDLCKLTGKPYFDRAKLNDSLGQTLTELLKRTGDMPQIMDTIQAKYQQDLDDMKAREDEYKKDEQESKLLRVELEQEKELVLKLTKQMEDLKDSMFPFIKETRELHDSYKKEKEDLEKKEKDKEKYQAPVPLYYPDYSNPSSVGWSNRNSSDDGWMCIQHGCSNYSSPSYVTVAGRKNFIVAGNSSSYTYSSIFFPIMKNQNINYYASSASSNVSYFIRYKGNSKVRMPNWKKASLKLWFQNYTAECNGWIYADCGSNGNQGYLQLNGGTITITICQQNNGYQSYSSLLVPVSSGDSYYLYHGGYPGVCYFIPGKKEYQVGMPNYEQEKGQSWGQEYEATEPGWVYAQCRSYNCTSTSTSNAPGYLMVDGNAILISKNNAGYYDNASVFVPVSKGSKYIAQGGYQAQSISFFPFIQ